MVRDILFSVNLAFILVHLYGGVIKWFYRPRAYAFCLAGGLFVFYFFCTLRMTHKIGLTIRYLNESGYSDSDDFPVRFAAYIRWVPVAVSVIVAVCFLADNQWVKMARDIVFIGVSIWFLMDALDPWRSYSFTKEENEMVKERAQSHLYRLSDEKFAELMMR